MRAAGHFIDGQPVGGTADDRFVRHDPATGESLGEVWAAGDDVVARAVGAAAAASPRWGGRSPQQRGDAVRDIARRLDVAAAELAELVTAETGRSPEDAQADVANARAALERHAALGPVHHGRSAAGGEGDTDLMLPTPRGVVAVIGPWRNPVAVCCDLLGAAVVTGNTVVLAPSERAPFSGAMLGRLFAEALPPGVVNVVSGDERTGVALAAAADLDLVVHIGTAATGGAVARAAAEHRTAVLMDTGGADPLIVDADVDPRWAADQAAHGCFTTQCPHAVERVYVHTEVMDAFVDELVDLAAGRQPALLVDRRHRDVVHRHVEDAVRQGARLLVGGVVPEGPGAFYPATVLSGCTHDMVVMREETAGPVAAVMVVDSFEEALELAGDSHFGRSATVLTASMTHAQRTWRDLRVGTVCVNEVHAAASDGEPRRGSGHGITHGPELLDRMTALRAVHLRTPHGRPEPPPT